MKMGDVKKSIRFAGIDLYRVRGIRCGIFASLILMSNIMINYI